MEVIPFVPYLVCRLTVLAVLLLTVPVAAQPRSSAPSLRQRGVILPASVEEATVRVARGMLTTFMFDSALAAKDVVVQSRDSHFERFVVEERTLTLKPRVELARGERLLLTVRFADGAAPAETTFELVAADEVVDASVEVVRRTQSTEALQAALQETRARYVALQDRCGEGGPAGFYLAGALDARGVVFTRFLAEASSAHSSGLTAEKGEGFRAATWGLVVVQVRLAPTGRAWTLGEANLVSKSGRPVKVKSIRMDKPRLASGEEGTVLVETEAPWWTRDEELRLELRDGGDQVSLSGIRL